MRLASITLPFDDYDVSEGIRLDPGHVEIKRHLKAVYRGYTRLNARGAWLDPNGKLFYETVYRYEFACEDTEQEQVELRALAFRVKVLTDEQSIMIVHASGEVEFI